MRRTLRFALPLLAVAGVLLRPAAALAHPLGNFTVNTSAAIVLTPGAVRVDYVLDLAEIPTVQAMAELDADGDGQVGEEEGSTWAARRAGQLLAGLTLTVDGRPVGLRVSSATVELSPGQGGLDVLRLQAAFAAEVGSGGVLAFRDANGEGRVGWHEVTATGVDGVALERSTVPTTSPTDRLRTYPQDLLSSPLDVREADLSFSPGTSTPAASHDAGPAASRPAGAGGAFADLVERTGPLMALALLLAFGFGALHALGPGHGKTLMAAYLVGGGGRARQAVAVGAAVAAMHTTSVLVLGVVVLTATEVFAPDRVYPLLGLGSGLVAFCLGAGLLVARLRGWRSRGRDLDHDHEHAAAPAGHGHGRGSSRSGHDHAHAHGAPDAPVLSRRGLTALAVAGGILPSPTALVVLLASVALGRVGYGLALIGAFSVGLATALVAVGVLALRARDVVARRVSGRLSRLVPLVSAAAIVVVGAGLAVNGAAQL